MKNKTFESLKAKAIDWDLRMPSIIAIHKMLEEFNVKHWFYSTTNIVEHRSKGRRYVNSRHQGKLGYELKIENADEGSNIRMYTSDSYYSCNSWLYAKELVKFLKSKGIE